MALDARRQAAEEPVQPSQDATHSETSHAPAAVETEGAPGEGETGTKAYRLTHNLWEQLSSHVYVFLTQTTLADVVEDRMEPCPAVPDFSALLDEEGVRA